MDDPIYLICYINKLDEDKIKELLNFDINIGVISLVRLMDAPYTTEELVECVKNTSNKYPWKIHDIVEKDYPEPLVMDVILDTAIRKNKSEYIFFFNNLDECTSENINKNIEIIENNKNNFGGIANKEKPYSNFATSFSVFITLNKNKNNEPLIDKINQHESLVLHEI
jgi:hypothetical protein